MKTFLFVSALFASTLILAQGSLEDVKNAQYQTNRTGMLILGTWAIGNMGIGFVQASRTTGSMQYFHQMNGIWNTVNLGLAGVGYFTASKYLDPRSLSEVINNQHQLETIFLVNGALDAAYIMTGVFLIERGKRKLQRQDLFKGYGQSLILQGAFLMAFDGIMYLLHKVHRGPLMDMVQSASISFTREQGMLIGLSMNF